MAQTYTMTAIGHVVGGRSEPIDDDWGKVEATIAVDADQFGPDALAALDAFSHLEVIFHFHAAPLSEINTGARRPRGRADWPLVGIFAQRGKGRPNRIGVTVCEIVSVEGLNVRVRGLDAIDGTPVLDLKPVMKGFLPRGTLREPDWAAELMREYW